MIEEILKAYKEIDLQIIKSIKEDKEQVVLLEKREQIIKDMLDSDISNEEIKKLYLDNGLKELDFELQKALEEKMVAVKNNIRKLAVGKEANKSYNSVNRKPNFFSTNA